MTQTPVPVGWARHQSSSLDASGRLASGPCSVQDSLPQGEGEEDLEDHTMMRKRFVSEKSPERYEGRHEDDQHAYEANSRVPQPS